LETEDMMKNNKLSENIRVDERAKKHIEIYMDFLLESNQTINLISRKMPRDHLFRLVWETIFINPLVSKAGIIDAGSGNGLLGVPLAFLDFKRPVVLVETKSKKAEFLRRVTEYMSLENVKIHEGEIGDYLKKTPSPKFTLVARGFPKLEILVQQLQKRLIGEILAITAKRKMIKIKKGMERISQKIYNIPLRNNIVIFKMENVSRET
jgi:16S rRNA (guanine(527)-N(7))-methyltransferase RsmG